MPGGSQRALRLPRPHSDRGCCLRRVDLRLHPACARGPHLPRSRAQATARGRAEGGKKIRAVGMERGKVKKKGKEPETEKIREKGKEKEKKEVEKEKIKGKEKEKGKEKSKCREEEKKDRETEKEKEGLKGKEDKAKEDNALTKPPLEPREKNKQILVLGLDGAGKTSVLHSLALNKVQHSVAPTQGFNEVCINTEESQMEFLEIGGSEPFRSYWEMYLSKGLLLIFVVDSADHNRLPEAKKHLHQLIGTNPILPLVVFANKQILVPVALQGNGKIVGVVLFSQTLTLMVQTQSGASEGKAYLRGSCTFSWS
uniref:Theg spermatid protein like n=1 Tax=Suricata suricatta TaxID=37032 RepID=A0A673TBP8_SURSU